MTHRKTEGHHCAGGRARVGLEERADDIRALVIGQLVLGLRLEESLCE